MFTRGLFFHGFVMLALLLSFVEQPRMVFAQNEPAPYYRTITVTTTKDDIKKNGNCTLREAVQAANTNKTVDKCPAGSSSSTDVIKLGKGTYSLTISGRYENANQKGDFDITQSVKILGAGRSSTNIDAKKLDRAFENRSSSATVTIQDLTIRNGSAIIQPSEQVDEGGAIANKGKMYITRVRFYNNEVSGGGIHSARGGAILNTSTLTISDSIFEKNTADSGGAIGNSGVIKIDTSTFKGNSANQAGAISTAGIRTPSFIRATVEIKNSLFQSNQSDGETSVIMQDFPSSTNISKTTFEGHAGENLILNYDDLTIRYSTFKNNSALVLIIVQFGSLNFTHSTVRNNTYGRITGDNSRLILDRMTFNDNGGPILAMDGSSGRLHNSTISGLKGSAIFVHEGGNLSIDMATIADNATNGEPVLKVTKATATIHNSILANTKRQSDGKPLGDCYVEDGAITSLGYNIISRTDGCDIKPASGDQFGTLDKPIDPKLDTLRFNGGYNNTRALRSDSPAVDKADPLNSFKTDQRVYKRPAGKADIGAYERGAVK